MYDAFYSPALSDSEFDSKPMVMLVGQYSTGKTSVSLPLSPSLPRSHPFPLPFPFHRALVLCTHHIACMTEDHSQRPTSLPPPLPSSFGT